MSIPAHISGMPVHGVMLREGDRLLFVRADKPVNDGDYPAVYVQTNDGWIVPVTMEPRQPDMDEALLTIAESNVLREQLENVHAYHERESARNDAEIRRLRDALLAYGNHKHDCGALIQQPCTCGLSASIWGDV